MMQARYDIVETTLALLLLWSGMRKIQWSDDSKSIPDKNDHSEIQSTNIHKSTCLSAYSIYTSLFMLLMLPTTFGANPTHTAPHGHLFPPGLALNRSYLDSLPSVALRKVIYLDTPIFVAQKTDGYDDSVDFVLQGWSGEPQVTAAFHQKLAHDRGDACRSAAYHNGIHRPIVLDIGANGGIYGLYAALMGCHVFFFDMQPACVRGIYSSTFMNGVSSHTHVIHHPVGNSSKPVVLDVSTNCFGAFRLTTGNQHKEYNTKQPADSRGHMTMEMIRLDDMFVDALEAKTLPRIVMVKLDTEGAELLILHGMKKLLQSKLIQELTVELSPEFWPAYQLSREFAAATVLELLWDVGYQNVTVFGNHGVRGVSPDTIVRDRNHMELMVMRGIHSQQDAHFVLASHV